jgi:hypothetical protein
MSVFLLVRAEIWNVRYFLYEWRPKMSSHGVQSKR